ncbi:hypothetical protein [Paucibacter soli]|uniref:hypothetical protein n=1 Tax=Paucibacter soli TaxID=3133433 RepID=UPI0030AB4CC9
MDHSKKPDPGVPREEPAFLDEIEANAPLPQHGTIESARTLLDLKPGQTLAEALKQKRVEGGK